MSDELKAKAGEFVKDPHNYPVRFAVDVVAGLLNHIVTLEKGGQLLVADLRDARAEADRLRGGAVPVATVTKLPSRYGNPTVEWANGAAVRVGMRLHTAPPAPAVPEGWKLVPIRMPDRMVAVMQRAKHDGWDLHGMWESLLAAAPAPVVPVGFSRDDLEAVAEGLESEPPTVNIGPIEVGDRDTSVESSAAFAARFIRAVLAAPPTPGVQDDVAKDAARYRFISQKICFTGNGDGTCSMHVINLPMRCHGWPEVGQVEAFVDAAIDAAMLAAAPTVEAKGGES